MRFVNPYEGVNFGSAERVKAISHEHIFDATALKNAYDRGIRYFACVNYQPACPSFPLRSWSINYEDYVSLDNLEKENKTYSGAIASFVDANGNTVNTDDLVQLPNAEHPCFSNIGGNHFNVLGSTFGDAGWGRFGDTTWRLQHPLYDVSQINSIFSQNQHFGKVFGTINHCIEPDKVVKFIKNGEDIFKAMELFNQGCSEAYNNGFKTAYDTVLSQGYRLWGTAVTDWPNYIAYGTQTRGCNVLLMDSSYNSLPANCFDTSNYVYSKAEAGLDAYIAGRYYMTGFGTHYMTGFTAANGVITLSIDSSATITAITDKGKTTRVGSTYAVPVPRGATYLRFEVDFGNEDFLYTNPVWIEDNNDRGTAQKLLLQL